MRYQFTNDLLTGNSIIDSEHKTLIKAADDAMQSVSAGQGQENLKKNVNFLADYTVTHFKHEEELQTTSKYPDIVAHKAWHKTFVNDLNGIARKIVKDGPSSVMVIELTGKISALINHIKTEDKKLANHIKNA